MSTTPFLRSSSNPVPSLDVRRGKPVLDGGRTDVRRSEESALHRLPVQLEPHWVRAIEKATD